MAAKNRYAQARGHCQELIAALRLPRMCGVAEFADVVGRHTATKVRLAPLRLPPTCTALWLGYTDADSVGYNQDWPADVISLVGHAVGHLTLGHCDQVRDGGQFACTVGGLGTDDPVPAGQASTRSRDQPAVQRW